MWLKKKARKMKEDLINMKKFYSFDFPNPNAVRECNMKIEVLDELLEDKGEKTS